MDNDISFLRQLLNYIDQKIAAQEQTTVNPMDRDDIFVPPLQAKLEIMKKLSGIPLKDETLKQSQEQGGPAPSDEQGEAPTQAQELKKQLTMSDLFGNEVTGE
jgi:NAD(P)H-dependent FMN reductase